MFIVDHRSRLTTRLATEEEKLLNEESVRIPPPKYATEKQLLYEDKQLVPKSNFSKITPVEPMKESVSSIGSDILRELGLDEEEGKP